VICLLLQIMGLSFALGSPQFPEKYHVVLEYQLPYIGVSIPISATSANGYQILSYFDGLSTEYVDLIEGARVWDIFNGTDRQCFTEGRSKEGQDRVKLFPDLNKFTFQGKTVIRGFLCDWYSKRSNRPGERENFYYDPILEVPVRWSMHSRDEIFDAHIDDYVVDYLFTRELTSPDHSFGLPGKCEAVKKKRLISSTGSNLGSHFHQRHKEGKFFALGYKPLPERRHIAVYGDSLHLSDILESTNASLPHSFDWRENGGVPARIKDQAFCGSCYAFSVVASIESAYVVSNNAETINLSEQFILDCGWPSGSQSCSGGNQQEVGPFLLQSFGGFLPYASDYGQYMSTYSYCKNTTGMKGIRIDGWVNLPSRSTTTLIKRALVSNGMLSVSINAVDEIIYYTGGIVRSDACKDTKAHDLNHAVNLVGYGTDEDGTDYYILRNSWSTNYGEQGFFRVEMGERDCGISIDVSFPIVKAKAKLVEEFDASTVMS
jgi:hypothetical protein